MKKIMLVVGLLLGAGCGNIQWPKECTPGDYECLPCTYPQSTNPSCAPFPMDMNAQPKVDHAHNGGDPK